MIALLIESVFINSLVLSCAHMVCFTIGICWLVAALVGDITNDLITLNVKGKHRNSMEVRKSLWHITQDFADIKQLSGNSKFQWRYENNSKHFHCSSDHFQTRRSGQWILGVLFDQCIYLDVAGCWELYADIRSSWVNHAHLVIMVLGHWCIAVDRNRDFRFDLW